MAFSGLHLSLYEPATSAFDPSSFLPVFPQLVGSETLASAGMFATAAPQVHMVSGEQHDGRVLACFQAASDSWVTADDLPADPSLVTSARMYVAAGPPVPLFVWSGCRFRWCPA